MSVPKSILQFPKRFCCSLLSFPAWEGVVRGQKQRKYHQDWSDLRAFWSDSSARVHQTVRFRLTRSAAVPLVISSVLRSDSEYIGVGDGCGGWDNWMRSWRWSMSEASQVVPLHGNLSLKNCQNYTCDTREKCDSFFFFCRTRHLNFILPTFTVAWERIASFYHLLPPC